MQEIETGVEMPEKVKGTGAKSKYGFKRLAVGDSLFFEGMDTKSRPYTAAKVLEKTTGLKFEGRTVDGGLRIWRVA